MKYTLLGLALLLVMACTLTQQPSPTDTGHNAGTLFTKPSESTTTATATPTQESCTVSADHLNVRDCGGTDCPVIDTLNAGDVVTIVTAGNWHQVETATGAGWINSNYCTIGE
jgi:uncharacterized protein YgiM (DUF1202 family)